MHLGHDPLELPSGRFTDVGGDGLEPVVEPVTGTERGRERVEDLRQLLLERTRAPEGANVQHEPRCDERGRTAQHCHADRLRVEQEHERCEAGKHVEAHERSGADVEARPVDVQLHRFERPHPGEQRLGTRAEALQDDARPVVRTGQFGFGKVGAELTANLLAPTGRQDQPGRVEDQPGDQERDDDPEEHSAHQTLRPPAAASRGSAGSKQSAGSVTPEAASLSAKFGRIPVGLVRAPLPRLREEEILDRHHFRLHPQHLGHVRDDAAAVDEPRDLNDHVERARDLLANRPQRQIDASGQHERLEPRERVARRVGVDRRQRALVAGVHRLEHVDRLGAANLADDDAVGPHAQRVPDEVADANLALPLDVRRPRLERDDVLLLRAAARPRPRS